MSPRSCDLGKHESENHDLYWVCPECVALFTKNHEIMKEELGEHRKELARQREQSWSTWYLRIIPLAGLITLLAVLSELILR